MSAQPDPTTPIVFKFNNTCSRLQCARCDEVFKPSVGLWPFIEGTWIPVCLDCARDDMKDFEPGQQLLDRIHWFGP